MVSPAFSLLVPCYNAAKYLPRLLETVRSQTQPFAEIICYDDASSDNTVETARQLGLPIIVGGKNHGPAYARNRLLEAARSPWVHFHDADDLLVPEYVEKISPLLDDTADVIVCQMDWVTESTRNLEIAWRFDQATLAADPVSANLRNPIGVVACAFRRELLRRIGGFDETLRTWEDADLQVRISSAGARYRVHPGVLAIGLRHERGASSVRNGDQNLEDRTRLLEQYQRTLDARYHPIIAAEAEGHAAWLLAENRRPDLADRDLAVCRAIGWRVPSSKNPVVRTLRAVFPSRWLLRRQAQLRRRNVK